MIYKYDAFISYSSLDKLIANSICKRLEDSNIHCWIAPRDVTPGLPYASEIVHGIKYSRIMILVYTKNSNISQHVRNEVTQAFNERKIIIPFLVDDTPMNEEFSYFLARKHCLNAYPNYEQKLEQLVSIVSNAIDDESMKLINFTEINGNDDESVSPNEYDVKKCKSNLVKKLVFLLAKCQQCRFFNQFNRLIFIIDCLLITLWTLCLLHTNDSYSFLSNFFSSILGWHLTVVPGVVSLSLVLIRQNLSYLVYKGYKKAWISILCFLLLLYTGDLLYFFSIKQSSLEMVKYPFLLLIGMFCPRDYEDIIPNEIFTDSLKNLFNIIFICWIILLPILWFVIKAIARCLHQTYATWHALLCSFCFNSRMMRLHLSFLLLLSVVYLIGFRMDNYNSALWLLFFSYSCVLFIIDYHGNEKVFGLWDYVFLIILASCIFSISKKENFILSCFIAIAILSKLSYSLYVKSKNIILSYAFCGLISFVLPFLSFGFNPYACIGLHTGIPYETGGFFPVEGLYVLMAQKRGYGYGLRDRYGILLNPYSYYAKRISGSDNYIIIIDNDGKQGIYDLSKHKVVVVPEAENIQMLYPDVYKLELQESEFSKYLIFPHAKHDGMLINNSDTICVTNKYPDGL